MEAVDLIQIKSGRAYKVRQQGLQFDKREGLLIIRKQKNGQLRLCWKDLQSGAFEMDIDIPMNKANCKHVKKTSSGDFAVLRILLDTSQQKHRFWFQDTQGESYERDMCHKVNQIFLDTNNLCKEEPSISVAEDSLAQLHSGSLHPAFYSDTQMDDNMIAFQKYCEEMTKKDGHNATTMKEELQKYRDSKKLFKDVPSNMLLDYIDSGLPPAAAARDEAGLQPMPTHNTGVDFQRSLQQFIVSGDALLQVHPDRLIPLMFTPDIRMNMEIFVPRGLTLPATEEDLRSDFSTHYGVTVRCFTAALATGQLGAIVKGLGLNQESVKAAENGDITQFGICMNSDTWTYSTPDEDELYG